MTAGKPDTTDGRFGGKVVLVTGGAGAIGRVTARRFAAEGATVVLAGRDKARLREAAEEIGADWVAADVTDARDAAAMVDTVTARHGGLHVAFNNAGVFPTPGPLADMDPDTWSAAVDINLTGVFLSMKYEIAHMRRSGGGVIVNMASNIGAHMRLPGMAAYAATKAAVSTLTRAAARDHAADNVRINAVSPGAVDTPMSFRPGETTAERDARIATAVPAGRVAEPDEIAAAVLWLASAEAPIVLGADLVLDGAASA
ncbi:SDR family oxidoreductase [Streptomyces sp. NPDC049881]|uniref:SDR family NAD(P)-dependent oxidoreductase n=1 Tax=Streptomyces sp. NPDC049881 TaxID=3155778 RepID=UPI003445EB5A